MINIIIGWGFCDIQNNQGLGKGYQPKPKVEADNPYQDLDYHKNRIFHEALQYNFPFCYHLFKLMVDIKKVGKAILTMYVEFTFFWSAKMLDKR